MDGFDRNWWPASIGIGGCNASEYTGVELRVAVEVDELPFDAVARVDTGNRWRDLDMITASVVDSIAVFHDVPSGRATVSVKADGQILCEQSIEIPTDELEVTTMCRKEAMRVAGIVHVGGQPAGEGTLIWMPPSPDGVSIIERERTSLGLERAHIIGGGRSQVDVTVDPSSLFVSNELRPGFWKVIWQAGGAGSRSLDIELPERLEVELTIDFPGSRLSGVVLDENGKAAEGARVRDVSSGSLSITQASGEFEFVGLEPGTVWIRADRGQLQSRTAEIVLEADIDPPPVELRLGEEDEASTLRIELEGEPRAGAANAFVFIETSSGHQRIASVGADRRASLRLKPPFPDYVRVAAYESGLWSFRPWIPWQDAAADGLRIRHTPSGTLIVTTETDVSSSPRLTNADGWDLSHMMARLGVLPPFSGEPWVVSGLPVGQYQVELGDSQRTVVIEEGRTAGLSYDSGE